MVPSSYLGEHTLRTVRHEINFPAGKLATSPLPGDTSRGSSEHFDRWSVNLRNRPDFPLQNRFPNRLLPLAQGAIFLHPR